VSAEIPDTRIKVKPNGPYVVTGGVPLIRRRIVVSEHGEPMTWQTTERFDAHIAMSLCRCGHSSKKPFCDGTHREVGFDGTETASPATYDERATTYEGNRVVVRDDRSLCEHAGFCGNRLSNVWDMVKGSGTDDSVVRAQMMAMIEHCPSGALTFRLTPDGADVEPELATEIAVTADGPYLVTGGIAVERSDGQAFETRNRMTLCRCGASANKPLCDGSHKKVGFQDA
jgi:CDGSH-type Zn-finger protein/ferredoxin